MRKVAIAAERAPFGELLDQRQQREVLGIGEKEAAQRAHAGLERRRRLDLVEPLHHRKIAGRAAAATALSQRASASLKSCTSVGPSSLRDARETPTVPRWTRRLPRASGP